MVRRRLRSAGDAESGITLIELIVATAAGMVVFFGLTMMVLGAMHNSTRISNRVHATAKARIGVQRVVKELQSACAARYLTPIRKGSSGTVLKFARAYGSAVSPNPVMSEVKLVGTSLVVWQYPVSGGSTPEWEFDETTPTQKQALITNAGPVSTGSPIFRYYAFSSGVATTALTVGTEGLTQAQAESVVKVDIALKVSTATNSSVIDSNGAATVQDSAYLRFSSPTYTTTSVNGPCE
jgi:hypothetical protein